jgi:nucleoside-diphosphate-sugar epimerase
LPPATILNIASGTQRRIGDILDDLQAIAGTAAVVELDASRLRPSEVPTAIGDATAARTLLDWAPQIPWQRTLTDTLNDWRVRVLAEPN